MHDLGDSDVVFRPESAGEPAGGQANENTGEQTGDQEGNQEGEQPSENDVGDVGAAFDQDERARRALEARQLEQARNPNRVNAWKQKGIVGTKKAKSLAKRDQRRAYYEYVRQEAERERERIAIEEQMFGDLIAEEREERKARIAEAKQALDEQNRARRDREEEERKNRQLRRVEIEKQLKEQGSVRLESDEDIEIADDISAAVLLESGDFVVAITPTLVEELSALLKKNGKVELDEIQNELLRRVYT